MRASRTAMRDRRRRKPSKKISRFNGVTDPESGLRGWVLAHTNRDAVDRVKDIFVRGVVADVTDRYGSVRAGSQLLPDYHPQGRRRFYPTAHGALSRSTSLPPPHFESDPACAAAAARIIEKIRSLPNSATPRKWTLAVNPLSSIMTPGICADSWDISSQIRCKILRRFSTPG